MIKRLFLCVTLFTSAATFTQEESKPTVYSITKDSVKYAISNPIKTIIASYLILNLCINGKDSIVCNGLKWIIKDLPLSITNDSMFIAGSGISLGKESYRFLLPQ